MNLDARDVRARAGPVLWGCLVLALGVGTHSLTAFGALPFDRDVAADEQRACLRCHGMATIGYRDPDSGGFISLALELSALRASVHGALACSRCHAQGYFQYPHDAAHTARELHCVQCHRDHPDNTDRIDFSLVEAEFQASVHARSEAAEAEGFGCHSCHDPHVFRASLLGREIAEIVRYDNQLCLRCHEALRDPLQPSHAWLPNRDRHWEAVRCLDCHTPLTDNNRPVSHEILSAKDSNVNCVNCHSQGQGLLRRLYQYRSREAIENSGFFAKAVFNDAYIVGMSRNPLIDWSALVILLLTLVGLGAHGYGRYRAYQNARAQQVMPNSAGDPP